MAWSWALDAEHAAISTHLLLLELPLPLLLILPLPLRVFFSPLALLLQHGLVRTFFACPPPHHRPVSHPLLIAPTAKDI